MRKLPMYTWWFFLNTKYFFSKKTKVFSSINKTYINHSRWKTTMKLKATRQVSGVAVNFIYDSINSRNFSQWTATSAQINENRNSQCKHCVKTVCRLAQFSRFPKMSFDQDEGNQDQKREREQKTHSHKNPCWLETNEKISPKGRKTNERKLNFGKRARVIEYFRHPGMIPLERGFRRKVFPRKKVL